MKIPWGKAPKRVHGLAHVFVGFHDKGYWIFWRKTKEGWISDCKLSGLVRPKNSAWKKSFVLAPNKKREVKK